MKEMNFDELLEKKAQREHDKLKTTKLQIPDTDNYLTAVMPSDYKILNWIGLMSSGEAEDKFKALDDAIYTCCPALQDQKLREQIGAKVPTDVVPMLFSVAERNAMGEPLFRFLGIFMQTDNTEQDDPVKN